MRIYSPIQSFASRRTRLSQADLLFLEETCPNQMKHTLDEILARLMQGFYPYFDRKNDAFYWDRESTRWILRMDGGLLERANRLSRDMDGRFTIESDRNWDAVLDDLMDRELRKDTWVNSEVADIYFTLLRGGFAHTIEAIDEDGALAGGLLGIQLGKAFLAETMYSRKGRPGASKACLLALIERMAEAIKFIDVQVEHKEKNHPVARLGESALPLPEYLSLLRSAQEDAVAYEKLDPRMNQQFPANPHSWRDAETTYIRNAEHCTLQILGFQVMQTWEIPLMAAMAKAVAAKNHRVLEIGYGLGISAGLIQDCEPKIHVVVEANRQVAMRAREDMKNCIAAERAVVFEGFWQDVVASDRFRAMAEDGFDGILFDTYPLSSHELRQSQFAFFETAAGLLRPGGRFTYFSDESSRLSAKHRAELDRQFVGASLETQLIDVNPWPNCEYWDASSIVHVVVTAGTAR